MGSHFMPTSYPTNAYLQQESTFTHNPYSRNVFDYSSFYTTSECQCEACVARHSSFDAPYYEDHASSLSEPTFDEQTFAELPSVPTEECNLIDPVDRTVKYIFIGQLPFLISDDKVNWLVREFGGASKVFGVEAIWKPNKTTGQMQHKGCAHVLVPRDEVLNIVNNLHHHVLVHHDSVLYGDTFEVEYWAGRAFPHDSRVASNALVCEASARQIRSAH